MSVRIFRISNVFAWSLAVLFGSMLFYVSQSVQRAENQLRKLNHQVNLELEAIRVLEAEWDYLNSPTRLEQLAQDHLQVDDIDMQAVLTDVTAIPKHEVPVVPSSKPVFVSSEVSAAKAPASKAPQPQRKPPSKTIRQSDRAGFSNLLNKLNDKEPL